MARNGEHEGQRTANRAEPKGADHNMGGDIGPASVRGSNVRPGGGAEDDAAPARGRAEPRANVAGRDDEWPVTAGSADKQGAPRTDETEGRDLTVGSDLVGDADPDRDRYDEEEGRGRDGGPVQRRRGAYSDEAAAKPDAATPVDRG